MEGTGRGRRTFSAGLLGLLLAAAGLLAIVLFDSHPALAEQPGEAGLQTDTESMNGGLDVGSDTRSELPSALQTQTPAVQGNGPGEFEA